MGQERRLDGSVGVKLNESWLQGRWAKTLEQEDLKHPSLRFSTCAYVQERKYCVTYLTWNAMWSLRSIAGYLETLKSIFYLILSKRSYPTSCPLFFFPVKIKIHINWRIKVSGEGQWLNFFLLFCICNLPSLDHVLHNKEK